MQIRRRLLAGAVALFFCASCVLGTCVAWAEGEDAGPVTTRSIAIAYDNSGSMMKKSDKWCSAKYSLEVIAAMMAPGDTLALFTMDSTGLKIELEGATTSQERARFIHDADLGVARHTETRTTKEALAWLEERSSDERYLIITTDGGFTEDGKIADVQKAADQAAQEGIEVIYLAIGAKADVIEAGGQAGITIKKATNDTVLPIMTDIANQVFGRAALGPEWYDEAAGTVSLDAPMSELIVFAQGSQVSIGELTAEGGTPSFAPEVAEVRFSEEPTRNQGKLTRGFVVNRDLEGIVATYSGGIPQGTYQLDLANATTASIYYQPNVNIGVELTDEFGSVYSLAVGEPAALTEGTYTVEYSLTDPATGEKLTSKLLEPARFSLKVADGQDTKVYKEGEPVELPQGVLTLIATAETPGGGRASAKYENVEVNPPMGALLVDLGAVPSSISIDDMDTSFPVSVSKESGEAITAEEWEMASLSVSGADGVPWPVEKTDQIGTFQVRPGYQDGDVTATSDALFGLFALGPAERNCTFNAAINDDHAPYRGQASKDVTFTPNLLTTFIRWLPLLVVLALLLAFLIMEALKPRLPRLRPTIELDDGEVYPLMYNRNKVRHRVWPPWAPETNSFVVDIQGYAGQYELARRFALGEQSVGLKAKKRRGGKRRFGFDEATLGRLERQMGGDHEHPDPEYSFLRTNTFTQRSGINIEGNIKGRRSKAGQWVPSATYRIRF